MASAIWPKLTERGVPRAAATYLVTSWLVLEVGHLLSLILDMPHWAMRFVFWLLVIGFLPAMVLASSSALFARIGEVDLPETEPAMRAEHHHHENAEGGGGHAHAKAGEVDPLPFIVGGLILLAILFLGASRYFGVSATEPTHGATQQATATSPAPNGAHAAVHNSLAVLAFANLSGDA